MSDPVVEELTEEVKNVSVGENPAIYTSDSRGSDEAGEGTYKVPFKTAMKVGVSSHVSKGVNLHFYRR